MIEKIKQIYHMLEDEQSKDTYIAQLNYLVTGDFRHLNAMIKKYMPQVLVPYDMMMSDLIHSLPKDKKIVLYGAGEDGKAHLPYFRNDKRFIGFCDKNAEKQKNGLNEFQIISPEQLFQMDDVSVVISTHMAREGIKEILKQANFSESDIYELPRNCVWPSIEEKIFDDRILGTFLELTKCGNKITKNYAIKLDDSHESEKLLHAKFGHCGIQSKQKVYYPSLAVDDQDRVALIKVDADGSALELLKSSEEFILRDSPTLAINIYFELADVVEIPIYIKELVPGYKLYIRYYSNSPGGTTLYAVMS